MKAGSAGDEIDGIWVPPGTKLPDSSGDAAVEEPEPEPEPDWQDKYLRALAETDNLRKRSAEQARLSIQRANDELLLRLLPVVDGFGRAVAAAESGATGESITQGLGLLRQQLATFLEGCGVTEIPCTPGDPFDPERHEAIVRLTPTEAAPEGTVAGVVEPGYAQGQRVLRPARVAVSAAEFDAEAD